LTCSSKRVINITVMLKL